MGARVDAAVVLREAFAVYARHISVVLGLSFATQAFWIVLSFWVFQNGGFLTGMGAVALLSAAASLLQAATMTRLTLAVRQGIEPQFGQIVVASLPKLLPLLLLSFVMSIVIGIGLLLFVLPGLFLLVRWSLAATIYLAGRTPLSDALGASWRATSGATFLTALVIVLFYGLCQLGIPWLAEQQTGPVGDVAGIEQYLILIAIATALIGPLPWIAFAELYLQLGGVRPGTTEADFGIPIGPGGPGAHVHVPTGVTGVAPPAAQSYAAHPSAAPDSRHRPIAPPPGPPVDHSQRRPGGSVAPPGL